MSIDTERKNTESEFLNNNPVRNLSISEFYKDAVIFITGATGFLGKVLIEKLLRTCSDIKAIYIHVRPKRGVSSDFRYKDFLKHDIFNNVRLKNPVLLEKIVCVAGDVTQSKLGLSDADYEMVLNDVTIVIHSAATVKFNEPLKNAGNLNAHGTKRLMEMCMKMRKLKSFVHVSTAFSNPGRNYVEEIVYPSCSPLDKDSFMNCIEILPAEVLDSIFDIIKGPHPNTYTLTKSIAELIVSEYSQRFPVAIVRPSIITGSLAEPYPGWVDNTQAITGIIMEIGRGTIKSIEGDRDLVCDIIPVDIVANTLIGAAWRGYVYNSQSAQVYNCTSGQLRPIFWKELGFYTQKWSRKFPSKYLMLYPHFDFRTNRLMHRFYETFFHLLPAYVFDIILKWQGSKPIMMKIAKKLQISCDLGTFFVLNQWIFENRNQKQLVAEIKADKLGDEFSCDISQLDYDEYIKNFVVGIRKYVLKDNDESLPKAKRKLLILFWVRTLFYWGLIPLLIYFFGKIFKLLVFPV